MATCPECGGTVQDNVCTRCGANVWPQGDAADTSGAPPPADDAPAPPADGGDGIEQASSGTRPSFVNAPESTPPPPPPPAAAPPPDAADGDWQPTPATAGADGGSSGSSSRTLWWVLGGVAALAVLGALAVFLVLRGMGLSADDITRAGGGSPERLAELHSSCDAGDMQACDDLYLESPFDSEEETFGDTCGGRNEPAGWCVDIHGETAPPN